MEKICPICDNRTNSSVDGVACLKCGFEYAYVDFFSSKKSLELWRKKLDEKKKQMLDDKSERFSKNDCFILSGNTVSFISLDEKKLSIFGEESLFEEKKNVLQYSRSERNSAILFDNGKMEVHGDNSYGQCNIDGNISAISILCGANSTYAVSKNGEVLIFGVIIDEKIKTWKNISVLACGSFHLLGLTKDKKVKIAGEMIEKSVIDKVSGWKNVKSICAATDCSIALFEDGSVSFAGRQNDPRSEAESWKNIVSIKADSSYVVGLTKDGTIKLAGSCKAYLDMGRSTAANWTNVIAITCSRSGIAAIFRDGTLKIVGNFSGNVEEIYKEWKKHIKI